MVLWVWLLVTAVTVATTWLRPRFRHWLLPPQRRRDVPWSGFEVFFVLVLYVGGFWPAFVYSVLQGVGFFARLYGPAAQSPGSGGDSGLAQREALWLQAFSFPLVVLSVVLFLRVASHTRP